MFTARDSAEIEAPVEQVFAFLDDPHNHAAVTPRLETVRDVRRLPNGGKRLAYTYRMAGVGIDGEIVQTVHEPNERMTFDLRGRLTGTIDLTFEPAADGTELTYAAEYDIPDNALTALGAPLVRRFNERQVRATLAAVTDRVGSDAD